MSKQTSTLLTYGQTAQLLGVAQTTLRRWVMERRIPFIKLGRSVRFNPAEIDQWLVDQSIPVGGLR